MRVIVALDTETGGLDPATDSLLSIGLVAFDMSAGEVLDQTEILVWDDHLQKHPDALRVNQIDISDHRSKAVTRTVAAGMVETFVRPEWRRATMLCHNTPFDLAFMRPLLGDRLGRLFWYQALDTCAVMVWLMHHGVVPWGSASLQKACDHFEIERTGQAHSALADARSALALYQQLGTLIGGLKL